MKHLNWLAGLSVGAVVLAAGVSGCACVRTVPEYQVQIPTLTLEPLVYSCETDAGPDVCITLSIDDYDAIVRELKAACLALGGSERKCQAEDNN